VRSVCPCAWAALRSVSPPPEALPDLAVTLPVAVEPSPLGTLIDIRLPKTRIRARPRGLEGRSSCGLCGVQRLADVVRPLPTVGDGVAVEHRAITRALATMEARQTLGQLTRATHAAAFARTDGTITHLREDVGRHNALDKLAGALARDGVEAGQGFILVTSRCSFEMVEKAARIGCPILVAVSAPTDLAIRKAELGTRPRTEFNATLEPPLVLHRRHLPPRGHEPIGAVSPRPASGSHPDARPAQPAAAPPTR